jgi:hypothetical protein
LYGVCISDNFSILDSANVSELRRVRFRIERISVPKLRILVLVPVARVPKDPATLEEGILKAAHLGILVHIPHRTPVGNLYLGFIIIHLRHNGCAKRGNGGGC